MNIKCGLCKGKGVIQKDGKNVGSKQPYTLICASCNGVGHTPSPSSGQDIE